MEDKQRIQSRSDIIRSFFRHPQASINNLVLIVNTILAKDTASPSLPFPLPSHPPSLPLSNDLTLPSTSATFLSPILPIALFPAPVVTSHSSVHNNRPESSDTASLPVTATPLSSIRLRS